MSTDIMKQTEALHAADRYLPIKVGREWKFKTAHGVETYLTKKLACEMATAWKMVYEAPKPKGSRRTVPPGQRTQKSMGKNFITKPGDVFTIKSYQSMICNTLSVNVVNVHYKEDFHLTFVNELKAWKFLKRLNEMGGRIVLVQNGTEPPVPFAESTPYTSRFGTD